VFAATQAAASFLKNLGEQFDNNWLYALAAYNAGPGNVRKAIKRNLERGKPTDFWHLDLPSETRQYVPRLLALREIFIHPEEHGIALTHISNTAHVEPVDTGGQIDLAVAAQMAGLSIDELYQLNPGYNRWATAPKGPHRLLLPAENVENFRIALADLPPEQRLTWQRHKIKTGETLGHIAQKFKVSVSMLREINNLRGNNIRAGKHLLVPTSRKKESDYTLSASNRLAQKQASGKGQRVEHTILPGDTLWDLSRSYGVGVHKLAKWNGLATRDALRPGKKLVLWLPEKRASTKQSSLSAQATRTIRYTVRRGDSLSGIAQRFNIRVADLKRWNRDLTGRRYLQPGQKLKLHIDVRQQSG
jgi:membrane-bound lytic murein transglycosylase D